MKFIYPIALLFAYAVLLPSCKKAQEPGMTQNNGSAQSDPPGNPSPRYYVDVLVKDVATGQTVPHGFVYVEGEGISGQKSYPIRDGRVSVGFGADESTKVGLAQPRVVMVVDAPGFEPVCRIVKLFSLNQHFDVSLRSFSAPPASMDMLAFYVRLNDGVLTNGVTLNEDRPVSVVLPSGTSFHYYVTANAYLNPLNEAVKNDLTSNDDSIFFNGRPVVAEGPRTISYHNMDRLMQDRFASTRRTLTGADSLIVVLDFAPEHDAYYRYLLSNTGFTDGAQMRIFRSVCRQRLAALRFYARVPGDAGAYLAEVFPENATGWYVRYKLLSGITGTGPDLFQTDLDELGAPYALPAAVQRDANGNAFADVQGVDVGTTEYVSFTDLIYIAYTDSLPAYRIPDPENLRADILLDLGRGYTAKISLPAAGRSATSFIRRIVRTDGQPTGLGSVRVTYAGNIQAALQPISQTTFYPYRDAVFPTLQPEVSFVDTFYCAASGQDIRATYHSSAMADGRELNCFFNQGRWTTKAVAPGAEVRLSGYYNGMPYLYGLRASAPVNYFTSSITTGLCR